jgi:hypothetical protein
MAFNIGSVFLGDSKKRLGLSASTPTPPSSPPGTAGSMSGFQNIPSPSSTPEPKTQKPQGIDPLVSLELRLRWIEALVLGSRYDPTSLKGKERERRPDIKDSETVCRSTEALSRKLQTVVDGNDGLKRFMSQCAFKSVFPISPTDIHIDDQHAHLLTPAFALSGLLPEQPEYGSMSSQELEIFLADMEQDIRAAARDMAEIEDLEKKGVTEAGKLGSE